MDDLNNITISGNLCAAPELKTSKNGKQYTEFRIANHLFVDGERKVYFFIVKIFGQYVKDAASQLRKGAYCIVNGFMYSQSYQSKKTGKNGTALIIISNQVRWPHIDDMNSISENVEDSSDIPF